MNIKIQEGQDTKQDLLAVGLFEDKVDYYKEQNPVLNEEISKALLKEKLKLEFGSMFSTKITNSTYSTVLVVFLGKKNEFTLERARRAGSKIIRYMQASNTETATTNIPELIMQARALKPEELGRAFTEGLILSEYVFDKYLSKPKIKKINSVSISWQGDKKEFEKGINTGRIIAENTNYTRSLVNEPPEQMTPEQIEKEALKLKAKNIKVTVIGKKQLQKEGMNGILGVGKGSIHEPRLIILEYNGGKDKPTAIVGKGITFDSGGYNLKVAGSMIEDMKDDMSGAAAVLGTIKTASELGLKKNIIGLIPTCENMIDGGSYKPGDILKMYNGKTVEVLNTDAEGRLILADALSYADKKFKPETIIEMSTLTGACMVALGPYTAGLFTKDDLLGQKLVKAGQESYDRVWPMPLFEEYMDTMDGEISDLTNLSKRMDRFAGAITAGVFLTKFVDNAKFAHLDIAGPAFLKEAKEYNNKGASGTGVRLLTYYFMD
ncbi:MAG: leucyl aminopeptidase [Candidatus Nanoarchaeia archaeon]